jgi:ubiquinone/menaquinone biosynthesis C-methylase UbiE
VLSNWRKHGEDREGLPSTWLVDPFSTGILFPDWAEFQDKAWMWPVRATYDPLVVRRPTTWLLAEGWKLAGEISAREVPPEDDARGSSRGPTIAEAGRRLARKQTAGDGRPLREREHTPHGCKMPRPEGRPGADLGRVRIASSGRAAVSPRSASGVQQGAPMLTPNDSIPGEILEYYGEGKEAERLTRGIGPLELARTQELLLRFLPPPPAVICDVGGGPGTYTFWLAELGHAVHLVDVTPLHIEQARQRAAQPGSPQPASMEQGDARGLRFADGAADAVILHGPLYHLTEHADRLAALGEARRVLRPGGVLLAFAIGHFASTIVGLLRGWVFDDEYLGMVTQEIATGQHRRPPRWPGAFTTAYFHRPEQLRAEIEAAGLACEGVVAVQGPAWMVPDFEASWQDPDKRAAILQIARLAEHEPVSSPHMVAVARMR